MLLKRATQGGHLALQAYDFHETRAILKACNYFAQSQSQNFDPYEVNQLLIL
jgi:hypothetical protein